MKYVCINCFCYCYVHVGSWECVYTRLWTHKVCGRKNVPIVNTYKSWVITAKAVHLKSHKKKTKAKEKSFKNKITIYCLNIFLFFFNTNIYGHWPYLIGMLMRTIVNTGLLLYCARWWRRFFFGMLLCICVCDLVTKRLGNIWSYPLFFSHFEAKVFEQTKTS